jgi:3-oxoacyl-[acyl-carrier-protein] synthase II
MVLRSQSTVPATFNLHRPDPAVAFNLVPLTAQEKKVSVAVTNSFGFGGTNSSLVFAKLD